jgi:hypothetical protein
MTKHFGVIDLMTSLFLLLSKHLDRWRETNHLRNHFAPAYKFVLLMSCSSRMLSMFETHSSVLDLHSSVMNIGVCR